MDLSRLRAKSVGLSCCVALASALFCALWPGCGPGLTPPSASTAGAAPMVTPPPVATGGPTSSAGAGSGGTFTTPDQPGNHGNQAVDAGVGEDGGVDDRDADVVTQHR